MQPHRLRLLFSKDQIEAAVGMLADQLNQRFAEKDPLFLVVMNGAYMFATDLLKQFIHPCTLAFIDVKSYSGTTRFVLDADSSRIPDLTNRHVVILEDIVDSGTTMAWLKKKLPGAVLHQLLQQRCSTSLCHMKQMQICMDWMWKTCSL